ncbi:MAG: DUF1329 domain-containing protein [Candidatus Binataceae bacterium]
MRYRYVDPKTEDNCWLYNPHNRRVKRVAASLMSDATDVVTIDRDSHAGFGAKIEDFNYRLIGIKPMLASVHAENLPAKPCEFDNGRTVCPEAWEMRQLYIIEATAKASAGNQEAGDEGPTIPKRIFYIDSEGWFITASDQYDRSGALWKTIANFITYRDRSVLNGAVYPFKRIFSTALVDEDIQSGFSSVVFTPAREAVATEGLYINMGVIPPDFIEPDQMVKTGY